MIFFFFFLFLSFYFVRYLHVRSTNKRLKRITAGCCNQGLQSLVWLTLKTRSAWGQRLYDKADKGLKSLVWLTLKTRSAWGQRLYDKADKGLKSLVWLTLKTWSAWGQRLYGKADKRTRWNVRDTTAGKDRLRNKEDRQGTDGQRTRTDCGQSEGGALEFHASISWLARDAALPRVYCRQQPFCPRSLIIIIIIIIIIIKGISRASIYCPRWERRALYNNTNNTNNTHTHTHTHARTHARTHAHARTHTHTHTHTQ